MNNRSIASKKVFTYFVIALFLMIGAFSVYSLITAVISFGELEDNLWDGVTVASSFSAGNGTAENPYVISNASEFMYFKSLIEGDKFEIYQDKYYALGDNIDFNGKEITPIGLLVKRQEEAETSNSSENVNVLDDDVLTDNKPISDEIIDDSVVADSVVDDVSSEDVSKELEEKKVTIEVLEERYFEGVLDGKGYSLSNYVIKTPTVIDDISYYSLFTKTINASILQLGMENVKIVPEKIDSSVVIANLVGDSSTAFNQKSTFMYNYLYHFQMDCREINSENITIGAFIGKNTSDVVIKNISLEGEIIGNTVVKEVPFTTVEDTKNISNIIDSVVLSNMESSSLIPLSIDSYYLLKNDVILLGEQEVDLDIVLDSFNEGLDLELYWDFIDGKFSLYHFEENPVEVPLTSKSFSFSIRRVGDINLHDSGTEGTSIYVNDLVKDYNYYMGLNFASSSDETIPTNLNKGLYGDNNLAKVYIHYDSRDYSDDSVYGTVSLTDSYTDYYYYKYYPIVDGYVTFDLIDNPWGNRPTNMAFNGWITDYEGAEVSLDNNYYVRKVKVPASNFISIEFKTSWIKAKVTTSNDFDDLNDAGMKLYEPITTYDYGDVSSYYILRIQQAYTNYPTGQNIYNLNGNRIRSRRCSTYGGCPYLILSDHSVAEEGATYYILTFENGNYTRATSVTLVEPSVTTVSPFEEGDLIAGNFEKVTVPYGGSMDGLYDEDGMFLSGTCYYGSCTGYKLIQFYDEFGNANLVDLSKDYYFLVTRDTNIMALSGSYNGLRISKPVTITSLHNGSNLGGTIVLNNYYAYGIVANADARIEHINLSSSSSSSTGISSNGYSVSRNTIIGNYHNLKIGRGINVGNDRVAGIYGGTSLRNTVTHGSSNNLFKYSLIVESGNYNNIYFSESFYGSGTLYMYGTCTLGNDLDRVRGNNSNLDVYYSFQGNAGSNLTMRGLTDNKRVYDIYVKSGSYGSSKSDLYTGIYVGGRGGNIYGNRAITVEGGYIYTIIGGLGSIESQQNLNSVYIYMKDGSVDSIFGGSGSAATYGNRIISLTGGNVNYSVFGGSNGSTIGTNSSDTGILYGDSYIYIGGNSTVGTETDTLFGANAGSVFGAGAGNNKKDGLGSVDNSNIVVNTGATIKGSVYGGGNYGSVGAQSTASTSTTNITILGGNINESVYGGGNNNGSGNSNRVTSTINIEVQNGNITNSVYGGSRTNGTIYGNTNVTINGGSIGADVYGGGEGGYTNTRSVGTYVRDSVAVTVNGGNVSGSVYGGSAFGTVNAVNQTSNSSNATTSVTVNGGVVQQNVFGGGKGNATFTPRVVGDITVTVNDGSIGNVFGGFDASGKPSNGDVVYLNGGVIGDAYGGGNNADQNSTDIRLQGSTLMGNLYGGSKLLGTVTESHVTVSSGTVTDVFGGNNLDGSTTTTNVSISGGNFIGDVYGGGNQAPSTTTNITIQDGTLNDVYGGGYSAGVSDTTNISVVNGSIRQLFGGSNTSGDVGDTNITVSNSYDERVDTRSVDLNLQLANNGVSATDETKKLVSIRPMVQNFTENNFVQWTATLTIAGSELSVVDGTPANSLESPLTYGGGTYTFTQEHLDNPDSPFVVPGNGSIFVPGYFNVLVPSEGSYEVKYKIRALDTNGNVVSYRGSYIDGSLASNPSEGIHAIYGGNNLGGTTDTTTIHVNGGTIGEVYGGGNQVGVVTSTTISADGGTIDKVFGGSNQKGDVPVSNVSVGTVASQSVTIEDVYGGNNAGGVTNDSNVHVYTGEITNVYGGGNQADVGTTEVVIDGGNITNVFGGGNAAGVQGNTILDINGGVVSNNIYGGGDEGIVTGNTEVTITDGIIQGNAFAGGNGSTAIVYQNSTITIDGNTVIGTENSEAPNEGCVFGSGNAASTGLETDSSVATVNLVGGIVYGNVYGGPKMAVVNGTTKTNIGTSAVENSSSLTESDIIIHGTVFGGGESNASGSENYDWNFVSVTEGITVNIDGTGYIANNHDFIINGSIFGSGNASTSSGESNIYIKNLGSMESPNKAISIQRTNYLEIESSVLELSGATDRTNDNATILYSFNIIDKMVIKNGTTLFLQHNANLLKEFYSGVDEGGELVPAVVDIDDENQTITKNVDNRIYMIPGQNLNVTINQAATSYGKVTGMTFFGMYNSFDGGGYRLGLYDPSYSYGDNGNASLEIIGGSYVLGLHHTNHDITKDGFYSNYLDEETFTKIETAYIDPSRIGEKGYRWIIGFEAINYEFDLMASKYSSLGTYELQLIDFAEGDTTFTVLGFDSTGLGPNLSLVDSNNVPRIGSTEEEANTIYGLSMKAETQEWTGYGTTKMLSRDNGDSTGDYEYRTDSRQLAPSLMFYLYHAKNISRVGNLGTVVLTLQAAIPKNAIDYDIKFVTITIHLIAINVDADSYDASITYDKKYEMPSSTSVNITNQSQFSAYFSLTTFKDDFSKVYGNNNENVHVLVTNHPLPVNTMITMLDYGTNPNRPEYYYFKVTQDVYDDAVSQLNQYNEITYRLNQFIKMDSTSSNNTYDDAAANLLYYDTESHLVDEEFMFIFDFKECKDVSGNHLNNTMLFELRTAEDRTVFNVYGVREPLMVYSTFDSSTAVLSQTFTDVDSYLYYDIPDTFNYSTDIQYEETDNRESVIDTNYESSKMGLNVVFLDKDGEQVSSSLLLGTSIHIGLQEYFADGDGVFRIKLANKVSNLVRDASITVNKDLPAGAYTVRYILFASDDGLHNSSIENSITRDFAVQVVSADNSIVVDCEDLIKVVDGETGLNLNNSRINTYKVKYHSQLTNPNFRVEIYKRDITTIDSTQYISVPFSQLFTNSLSPVRGNEVSITMDGVEEKDFEFELKDNLTSGTYRIVFRLYDSDQLIDEEIKYVIVKKKIE